MLEGSGLTDDFGLRVKSKGFEVRDLALRVKDLEILVLALGFGV